MQPALSDSYLDNTSLNKLKSQSNSNSQAGLKAVAAEFESIFVKMMMKSMRDASFGNPLFDSDSAKVYRDMYDDQLSLDMSKNGGLGLADMMVRQLGKFVQSEKDEEKALPITSYPTEMSSDKKFIIDTENVYKVNVDKTNIYKVNVDKFDIEKLTTEKFTIEKTAVEKNQEDGRAIKSPQDFVKKLWPLAESASEKTGISPKVLIAQAALETGWGKYMVRKPDGQNSFNLFNIKADHRWDGDKAEISTVEYTAGVAHKKQADFRVYDSFSEGFDDYVNFLQKSPRYSNALSVASDDKRFVSSLQASGYATDPNYAQKIERIMNDRPLNDALTNLALGQGNTI